MWDSPGLRGGHRGVVIKHAANRSLYRYWDRLRGNRPAPMRHEIEPAEIGPMLSDTFILEATDDRSYTYRLAGTRVCGYFGRELKGVNWLDGWSAQDSETLATLLRAIVTDGTGGLVRFTGHNEQDQTAPFEAILLPLVNRGTGFTRVLCATVPLDRPYWLGTYPIVDVELDEMNVIWPNNSQHFRPPTRPTGPDSTVPLVRRGHLALYDGGRTD